MDSRQRYGTSREGPDDGTQRKVMTSGRNNFRDEEPGGTSPSAKTISTRDRIPSLSRFDQQVANRPVPESFSGSLAATNAYHSRVATSHLPTSHGIKDHTSSRRDPQNNGQGTDLDPKGFEDLTLNSTTRRQISQRSEFPVRLQKFPINEGKLTSETDSRLQRTNGPSDTGWMPPSGILNTPSRLSSEQHRTVSTRPVLPNQQVPSVSFTRVMPQETLAGVGCLYGPALYSPPTTTTNDIVPERQGTTTSGAVHPDRLTDDKSHARGPSPKLPETPQSSSAPTLGTFQRFRVSGARPETSTTTNAILDSCAFGPDANFVSTHLLEELGVFELAGSTITLKIEALEDGPVQKGLTYRERFQVSNRRGMDLLLGRDWIKRRWDDCTFYTLRGGSKQKTEVRSDAALEELQRREREREQAERNRSLQERIRGVRERIEKSQRLLEQARSTDERLEQQNNIAGWKRQLETLLSNANYNLSAANT